MGQDLKLNLDTYVPGLLLWLTNKLASSATRLYKDRFGIAIADWRVLSYLQVYPWSTAASACELMGMDKAAVSRSLSFMMSQGWLESRPKGLRKVEYTVSPEGRKLHDRAIKLVLARQEALLTGLTDDDRQHLLRCLHRMLDNLAIVEAIESSEA
jgi:DNA-binding MarR family transcriptional regulator